MLLLSAAKNDDIIQANHAVREIQFAQCILHKTLKSHQGITQPERHVGELIESEVTHCKGCVLLGLRSHLDLPEASLEVH